jgi:hypothetical protein
VKPSVQENISRDHGTLKLVAVVGVAFALLIPAETPAAALAANPSQSLSGQFSASFPAALDLRTKFKPPPGDYLSLDPALLVVSCDRIKEALCRDLGLKPQWRGKIYLRLHSARSADETVVIVTEKMPVGWNYRVELPDVMEQRRFVRAIVHVLLMEIANREGGSRPAEIPPWLAEGFAQQLLASDGLSIILPPPGAVENGLHIRRQDVQLTDSRAQNGPNTRRLNPLTGAQKTLRACAPLTFEQLSWPADEAALGESSDAFRSSAQLFVDRLLRLPNGPACLRAMLEGLPRRYNWQFAFFDGFEAHFKKPLDVEKWWALQLVQFTGRDLMQTWTVEESWNKLDEILHASVGVRVRPNDLPLPTEVSLQTILREWDQTSQGQVFQRKLQELDTLRLHVAQEVIAVVDEYRQVIGTYLEKRDAPRAFSFLRRRTAVLDRAAKTAIQQLDALDAASQPLRPAPLAPPAPVAAVAGPDHAPAR